MNAPVRPAPTRPRRGRRHGFTFIELAIVMVIISLLISFILVASYEGLQRSNERATQALITKIDLGLAERMDALLSQKVEPNGAHQFLARVYPPALSSLPTNPPTAFPQVFWGLPSDQRAQVIALLDYLKAEMPDVFVLGSDTFYPLDFASVAYPLGVANPTRANYVLPLGHLVTPGYKPGSYTPSAPVTAYNLGPGANYITDPTTALTVNGTTAGSSTGIYGASYAARGAFYKLLGFPPQSYDGVDNDGNGWIDEFTATEFGVDSATFNGPAITGKLNQLTSKHTHKTARAECLYAFLVGGIGPLGSVFSPDEFSQREVGDTDNDGLPEFIDAWGEPLQFYRWPVHYTSAIQKGLQPYSGMTEPRQTAQFDPNNLLVAPSWWSLKFNGGTDANSEFVQPSGNARAVMAFFTSLIDFNAAGRSPLPSGILWDRSGGMPRAAYFSRPLVVSAGQDQKFGVAQLGLDYSDYGASGGVATFSAVDLIQIENTASNLAPFRNTDVYRSVDTSNPNYTAVTNGLQSDWGLDDITNQNLQIASGGVK